jgi:hypothetical protein
VRILLELARAATQEKPMMAIPASHDGLLPERSRFSAKNFDLEVALKARRRALGGQPTAIFLFAVVVEEILPSIFLKEYGPLRTAVN